VNIIKEHHIVLSLLRSAISGKAEYGQYVGAIVSLAKEYSSAGIDTMLLKGYGLSLNWPVPEHRPVGDIDTYHFGKWRKADELV